MCQNTHRLQSQIQIFPGMHAPNPPILACSHMLHVLSTFIVIQCQVMSDQLLIRKLY